jgi:putative nucleotidyltransferase with HDIG domain
MAQHSYQRKTSPEEPKAQIDTGEISQNLDDAIAGLQQMRSTIHRCEEELDERIRASETGHEAAIDALESIPEQSQEILHSSTSSIDSIAGTIDSISLRTEEALRTFEQHSREEQKSWNIKVQDEKRIRLELEERVRALDTSLHEALEQKNEQFEKLTRLQEILTHRELEERKLVERITHLQAEIEKLKSEQNDLTQDLQRSQIQLEESNRSRSQLENRLSEKESELDESRKRLAQFLAETEASGRPPTEIQIEPTETRSEIFALEEKYKNSEEKILTLTEERNRLLTEKAKLENDLSLLQAQEALSPPPTSADKALPPSSTPEAQVAPYAPSEGETEDPVEERDFTREQIHHLNEQLTRTESERSHLTGQISKMDHSLREVSEENQRLRERLEQRTDELDELQKTSADMLNQSNRREALSHYQDQIAKLEQERNSDTQKIQDLESRLQNTDQEREESSRDLNATKETLLNVLRKKVDLEVQVRKMRGQSDQFQELKQQFNTSRHERGLATTRANTLNALLAKTLQKKKELEQELHRLRSELETKTEDLEQNASGIDLLRNRVSSLQKDRREASKRANVLEKQLGKKFPAMAEAAKIGQELIEGDTFKKLVFTFDFLWDSQQGYPLLDVQGLGAIIRRISEGLRRDPAGVLERTNYTGRGYLKGHSLEVAKLSVYIGMHLGYQASNLEVIGIAALLHDLGMIQVPRSILDKSTSLDDSDREVIHKHCAASASIFRELEVEANLPSQIVARVIEEHHERMDGSGYPNQKKGDEIHPFSRIISIADAYTAMISRRPHREAMLPHDALRTIQQEAQSGALDPEIAEAFTQALSTFPIGSLVQLSTGEIGIVVTAHPDDPERPVVRLTEGEDGKLLEHPIYTDLSNDRSLSIRRPIDPRSIRS